MTTEQLKEYLGIVLDMEKERYLQNNLRAQLNQRISSLGVPDYSIHKPDSPKSSFEYENPFSLLFGCIIIGGIGGGSL